MKRLFGIIATILLVLFMTHFAGLAQQAVNPLANLHVQSKPVDQAQYDALKANWVEEHSSEYEQLLRLPGSPSSQSETEKPYGASGNKEAWIAENPELYLEMQKPLAERKVLSRKELESFPKEKQASMSADPSFKIID
jgi:hypothetical protein